MASMRNQLKPIPMGPIDSLIHMARGQRVMLDSDLATLFGVPVKRLNEQVKRNRDRFPGDFMFQLTAQEAESLRSQSATLKKGRAGAWMVPGNGFLDSPAVNNTFMPGR